MRKRKYVLFLIVLLLSISSAKLYADDDISKYLILSDIPPYQRLTKTIDPDTEELKTIPGYWIDRNAGVLMGSDHFWLDHMDITYKADYQSKSLGMGMEVQVTQHTGGDSDRWLLHEIERSFRRGNYEEDMVSARFRNIDGNNLFYGGLGGAL